MASRRNPLKFSCSFALGKPEELVLISPTVIKTLSPNKSHYVNDEFRVNQKTDAFELVKNAKVIAKHTLKHRGLCSLLNELFVSFKMDKLIELSPKSKVSGFFQMSRESVQNLRNCESKLKERMAQETANKGGKESTKNFPLSRLLFLVSKLIKFSEQQNDNERIEFLIQDDGFGLMLFMILLSQSNKIEPEKREWVSTMRNLIEMDVRGRCDLLGDKVFITVGEIKTSSSGFRKAKEQLNLRGSLLEATCRILFRDIEEVMIQKVIMVPADSNTEEFSHLKDIKVITV